MLSAGETPEEILRQYPMLEPEDIPGCLAFASRLMGHKYSVKETSDVVARYLIDANLPRRFTLWIAAQLSVCQGLQRD